MSTNLQMVITDLDGTLLDSQNRLSAINRQTLEELGNRQIIRVVATGRSRFAARRVLDEDSPMDYLIFSSGIGILKWPAQKLLFEQSLQAEQVELLMTTLIRMRCDFMVHQPLPDNHCFAYYQTENACSDFCRRLQHYHEFAVELGDSPAGFGNASQFVIIAEAAKGVLLFERLHALLPEFNVIRTTSPLDQRSVWVEIFPKAVSKPDAAKWLAQQHQLPASKVLAVGNDYNDLHLLQWAGRSYVVGNAPAEMQQDFDVVASHDAHGFTEAVRHCLQGL